MRVQLTPEQQRAKQEQEHAQKWQEAYNTFVEHHGGFENGRVPEAKKQELRAANWTDEHFAVLERMDQQRFDAYAAERRQLVADQAFDNGKINVAKRNELRQSMTDAEIDALEDPFYKSSKLESKLAEARDELMGMASPSERPAVVVEDAQDRRWGQKPVIEAGSSREKLGEALYNIRQQLDKLEGKKNLQPFEQAHLRKLRDTEADLYRRYNEAA